MTGQNRPHKRQAANPDDTAAQLRILVREAHEAMAGLRGLIRDAQKIIEDRTEQVIDRALEDAVNPKIAELEVFLKEEAAKISAQMAEEVERGREWVMENMTPAEILGRGDNIYLRFGRKEPKE